MKFFNVAFRKKWKWFKLTMIQDWLLESAYSWKYSMKAFYFPQGLKVLWSNSYISTAQKSNRVFVLSSMRKLLIYENSKIKLTSGFIYRNLVRHFAMSYETKKHIPVLVSVHKHFVSLLQLPHSHPRQWTCSPISQWKPHPSNQRSPRSPLLCQRGPQELLLWTHLPVFVFLSF